jgi:hypothetical protein
LDRDEFSLIGGDVRFNDTDPDSFHGDTGDPRIVAQLKSVFHPIDCAGQRYSRRPAIV